MNPRSIVCLGLILLLAPLLGAQATSEVPDLLVEALSATPSPAREGESITVKATVRNSGNVNAGPFRYVLVIDGAVVVNATLPKLGALQSAEVTHSWNPVEGPRTLQVRVDADGEVAESNEANNVRELAVPVGELPVPPSAVFDRVVVLNASFPPKGTFNEGRSGASVVWNGSHFLLFHGHDIFSYDPVTDALAVAGAKLPGFRQWSAAVWTGQAAYVFGGGESTILRYDPVTDTLETVAPTLPDGAVGIAAAWDGKTAYLFGGSSDRILRFDPSTNELRVMNETLPSARAGVAAGWTGKEFLIVGGGTDEILRYDPVADRLLVASGRLPHAVERPAAAWHGDQLYVFGGRKVPCAGHSSCRPGTIFTATANASETAERPIRFPFGGESTAAAFAGGHGYVFGGYNGHYPEREFARYTPPPSAVPELVALKLDQPTIRAGETGRFSAELTNAGSSNAPAFDVRFLIGFGVHLGTRSVPNLAPGASITLDSDLWDATEGTHVARLQVDMRNTVPEYNESNNRLQVQFVVDPQADDGSAGDSSTDDSSDGEAEGTKAPHEDGIDKTVSDRDVEDAGNDGNAEETPPIGGSGAGADRGDSRRVVVPDIGLTALIGIAAAATGIKRRAQTP